MEAESLPSIKLLIAFGPPAGQYSFSHAGALGYPPPALFSRSRRSWKLQPGGRSPRNFPAERFATDARFGGGSSRASVSAPGKADFAYPARSDFSGARPRGPSSAGELSSGTKQRTRTITRRASFGCYSGAERPARATAPWSFYGRSPCDQHYRRRNLIHRDRDSAGRGPDGRRSWFSHPPLAELALRAPLHGGICLNRGRESPMVEAAVGSFFGIAPATPPPIAGDFRVVGVAGGNW